MLVEFKIKVEIPDDPNKLAEDVYRHIYEDDYYDYDDLNSAIFSNIMEVVETMDFSEQLPTKYIKQYYHTLNKLTQYV